MIKLLVVGVDKILKPVTLPALTTTPYSPLSCTTLPDTSAVTAALTATAAALLALTTPPWLTDAVIAVLEYA